MLREMSTSYGASPGGYVWAIIEPLGVLVMMSLGFALLLRTPALGDNFMLFYATGYLPFSLYLVLANNTSRAIHFSRPLLQYPAVTWLDAILARFMLTMVTNIAVACILLTGIFLTSGTRSIIDLVPILEATVLTALLGLAVGTVNCLLGGLFPVWLMIWSIVTRPLFLASGVIFIYEDLPRPVQDVLWYNPLMHIVGLMRRGFYPTYTAGYVTSIYVLAIALILLTLGLIFLHRHHRTIMNR